MPEPIIDEVNDAGIILADGTELSYDQLAQILAEFDANLIRSVRNLRESLPCTPDAAASTFSTAAGLFTLFKEPS